MYGRSWITGSMSAESPTVGIWNTCKICTVTLRDTLSSGINLSSMSAMVTDLQTHKTPEGLLSCPVFGEYHISTVAFCNLDMESNNDDCTLVCRRLLIKPTRCTALLAGPKHASVRATPGQTSARRSGGGLMTLIASWPCQILKRSGHLYLANAKIVLM